MIAAVVLTTDVAQTNRWLSALPENASCGGHAIIPEIRLDWLLEPGVRCFVETPRPMIATVRRRKDGGRSESRDADRLWLLNEALRAGARYVDLECDLGSIPSGIDGDRVIWSRHELHETPGDLAKTVEEGLALGAAYVKVACRLRDLKDLLALNAAARLAPGRVLAVGLGPLGALSRILFQRLGSAGTYALAWNPDSPADVPEGLVPLETLFRLERRGAFPEPMKVFGVLSDAPEHSIGPRVFERLFDAAKLPAVYLPLLSKSLEALGEVAGLIGLSGASVTVPHKEAALRLANELDAAAKAARAVNTVLFGDDGQIQGFNTDVIGVRKPLEARLLRRRLRSALVLGSGGAARAAVLALKQLGADVFVRGRNRERVQDLVREFGVSAENPSVPPEVIVQATPLGSMREQDGMPIAPEEIPAGAIAFEMNYRPVLTPFLRAAKARGAEIIFGHEMYSAQAEAQWGLFLDGLPVPLPVSEVTKWALEESTSS